MNIKPKDLYAEYKEYCKILNAKPVTKHIMTKNLREINIDYSKTTRKYESKISFLDTIAKKFSWYSDDDIEELEANDIYNNNLVSFISMESYNNLEKKYKELLEKYEKEKRA